MTPPRSPRRRGCQSWVPSATPRCGVFRRVAWVSTNHPASSSVVSPARTPQQSPVVPGTVGYLHSSLQPGPNEQSAALRAILLTLGRSAIPSEAPTGRDHYHPLSHVCETSDAPACHVRHHAGEAMAELILAEFGQVNERTLRRPPTKMRWAQEMTTALLRRESSNDTPGRPPSRLLALSTHVVDRWFCCAHPHHPWSRVLRRNYNHQRVIVCVSIPDASIDCSSQSMEEGPVQDCPLCLTDPLDVELESPARNCLLCCSLNFGR
jgi:hypothetical protein